MNTLRELLENFFTHKDFLPPADKIAGTLFTPLHIVFAVVVITAVIFGAIKLSKKNERAIRTALEIIWITLVVLEISKILWETFSGKAVSFEWTGILPLYPCSIFMYAMPFALWGNEYMKKAGCGYLCTLGLLGAAINFFYPANVLSNYSCLSFAGAHTMLFHGVMLFCCMLMQTSAYHRYTHMNKPWEMLLPAIPTMIVSIPANLVNYSPIGSDYMFFKCNSFFLPAVFGWLEDWQSTVILYVLYLLLPVIFYLPGMLYRKKHAKTA